MIKDYCKFIADIEVDPLAIVPEHTIKDLLLLKQHIQQCKKCLTSIERVQQKYAQNDNNGISINLN